MKPKKCKYCKQSFQPKRSTLEQACSIRCAVELGRESTRKKQAEKQKEFKAELKEKTKTLSQYETEAKKSFQKFIRLRDKGLPCISCGNKNVTDPCGGHFFAAGIYSALMFDERNCHLQCNAHCNKYLSGNQLEYRKGLVIRYGEAFVKQLEADSDIKRNYKYTKQELIAKKLQYDLKIKEYGKI